MGGRLRGGCSVEVWVDECTSAAFKANPRTGEDWREFCMSVGTDSAALGVDFRVWHGRFEHSQPVGISVLLTYVILVGNRVALDI